jgi:hypothetical protein
VLEMLEDPEAALRHMLEQMRPGAYALLHRLRRSNEDSHPVFEETYCGYPARNYIWNALELHHLLAEYGRVLYADQWDASATLVFQKHA